MAQQSRRGFSIVEGVIILGVVVLLAGLGFVGWKSFSKSSATTAASTTSVDKPAEVITTKADLERAEKALSELDFSDQDGADAEIQASL